jgi:hypothetical protein
LLWFSFAGDVQKFTDIPLHVIPYAHVDIPNCIQVLEVMKALHIQEISVVNTTTTKGMIVSSEIDFIDWEAIAA